MRQGSFWQTKVLSASCTLSTEDLKGSGRFLITTAGIVVNVPGPQATYGREGWETRFTNLSSGPAYIVSIDGFIRGRECIVINPGETINLDCYLNSPSGWIWDALEGKTPQAWHEFTPLVTYATADPTSADGPIGRYCFLDSGLIAVDVNEIGTDGNDCSGVTVELPGNILPEDIDVDVALIGYLKVNVTESDPCFQANASDNTVTNRKITAKKWSTLTNAVAYEWGFRGLIDLGSSMKAYTCVVASTGTAVWTNVARYRLDPLPGGKGLLCQGVILATTADGKGDTGVTATPPVAPPDLSIMAKVVMHQKVNVTWNGRMGYLDLTDDTITNRVFTGYDIAAWTNAQAGALVIAFAYPIYGAEEYDLAAAGVLAWTGTAPATQTRKSYVMPLNGEIYWWGMITSADGNGATNLTIKAPVAPAFSANDIRVSASVKVNATYSIPHAFFPKNKADPAERLLKFKAFPALTDGQAMGLWFFTVYPAA